jgi:hypothetical protein
MPPPMPATDGRDGYPKLSAKRADIPTIDAGGEVGRADFVFAGKHCVFGKIVDGAAPVEGAWACSSKEPVDPRQTRSRPIAEH